MGYGVWESYGVFSKSPANEVGNHKNVWGSGGYGFSGLWVKGVSTVCVISTIKTDFIDPER
jgi:hypothetical protein